MLLSGPRCSRNWATSSPSALLRNGLGAYLETAAGTGIVTRRLRDRLPAGSEIIATDLSPAMLATAETKFSPGEVTLTLRMQ